MQTTTKSRGSAGTTADCVEYVNIMVENLDHIKIGGRPATLTQKNAFSPDGSLEIKQGKDGHLQMLGSDGNWTGFFWNYNLNSMYYMTRDGKELSVAVTSSLVESHVTWELSKAKLDVGAKRHALLLIHRMVNNFEDIMIGERKATRSQKEIFHVDKHTRISMKPSRSKSTWKLHDQHDVWSGYSWKEGRKNLFYQSRDRKNFHVGLEKMPLQFSLKTYFNEKTVMSGFFGSDRSLPDWNYDVRKKNVYKNSSAYNVGKHRIWSMSDLLRFNRQSVGKTKLTFKVVLNTDVSDWIMDNSGSVVQVASQANAQEMPDITVKTSDGIRNVFSDITQGPACVLTTFPSLLYRVLKHPNFNALEKLGIKESDSIPNHKQGARVVNGYLFPNGQWDDLALNMKNKFSDIRVMTLEDAPVTGKRKRIDGKYVYERDYNLTDVTSNQVFAWAVPNGVYGNPPMEVNPSSAEVHDQALRAAYYSTLAFAVYKMRKMKKKTIKVGLTLVGGGVFNVPIDKILLIIGETLDFFKSHHLQVELILFNSDWIGEIRAINQQFPVGK